MIGLYAAGAVIIFLLFLLINEIKYSSAVVDLLLDIEHDIESKGELSAKVKSRLVNFAERVN